jgi:hypothetical protein
MRLRFRFKLIPFSSTGGGGARGVWRGPGQARRAAEMLGV